MSDTHTQVTLTTAMDDIAVVLFEPQDPINIGSAVRACANAGVRDIRVIRPRVWDHDRMLISAPGLEDFAEEALRRVETWEEAVVGLSRTYALTARGRAERQQRHRLGELTAAWPTPPGARVGFVFGREDHGLPNDIVDRCYGYVTLETAEHASLNLAQAVMLVVHRIFVARGDAIPMADPSVHYDAAPQEAIERMMGDAEQALEALAFFKGDQRENVLRTVRRVLLKAELDQQELATFWGIWKSVRRNVPS